MEKDGEALAVPVPAEKLLTVVATAVNVGDPAELVNTVVMVLVKPAPTAVVDRFPAFAVADSVGVALAEIEERLVKGDKPGLPAVGMPGAAVPTVDAAPLDAAVDDVEAGSLRCHSQYKFGKRSWMCQ